MYESISFIKIVRKFQSAFLLLNLSPPTVVHACLIIYEEFRTGESPDLKRLYYVKKFKFLILVFFFFFFSSAQLNGFLFTRRARSIWNVILRLGSPSTFNLHINFIPTSCDVFKDCITTGNKLFKILRWIKNKLFLLNNEPRNSAEKKITIQEVNKNFKNLVIHARADLFNK